MLPEIQKIIDVTSERVKDLSTEDRNKVVVVMTIERYEQLKKSLKDNDVTIFSDINLSIDNIMINRLPIIGCRLENGTLDLPKLPSDSKKLLMLDHVSIWIG